MADLHLDFVELKNGLLGEFHTDLPTRCLYATDASVYEEIPAAVATPAGDEDLLALIQFANRHRIGLIARTAGTSLAGQVVGSGIVVDVSRHLNQILEIDECDGWVRVQPGIIRDELNRALAAHELFFPPETSTSNRAMIGGMIGNNSSGANSIVFGDTRSHVMELTGFLGDGTRATFGAIEKDEFELRRAEPSTLGKIYSVIHEAISDEHFREEIRKHFPRPSIHRRNTGYALDSLIDTRPFAKDRALNLCSLLTGSEGTLFFITAAKLRCAKLPPPADTLICAHFESIDAALRANVVAMNRSPSRCELMDHFIIAGIRENRAYESGVRYINGQPAAILMIEFNGPDQKTRAEQLVGELSSQGLGYDFPVLNGAAVATAWQSRKAALGGLSNIDPRKSAVTLIEDAAVDIHDLPAFVAEVCAFLRKDFQIDCVVYGHAGAGELHLRPWLDLGRPDSPKWIRDIATQFASIVKKYRGSLCGEHGSGRSRSELIADMVGADCYRWMQKIKDAFDPNHIFNPGKIVEPVPLDAQLKAHGPLTRDRLGSAPQSMFRFAPGGLAEAAQRCSGSGDCRKSHLAGGTMCPSYHATRNEHETTRGRANLLRQYMSTGSTPNANPLRIRDHDVRKILELCLSCKACKSECPSNVDMARMKSEFLYQYNSKYGVPLRDRILANFETWCERFRWTGAMGRFVARNSYCSHAVKWILGIHPSRRLPDVKRESLRRWFRRRAAASNPWQHRPIMLFCDEFTNQIDVEVGQAAIELLEALGYEVKLTDNVESGRSAISLGKLDVARRLAEENVLRLTPVVQQQHPIVGIEPSALLTLRDEYPDLVRSEFTERAIQLSRSALTIDEFLVREMEGSKFDATFFRNESMAIRFHGHCHQKAISSCSPSVRVLSLPTGSQVEEIRSGCCGMAGFFGYDREKFALSMQIGELLLFPAIRQGADTAVVAATGTSCRQQILDATGITALHPVQILRKLLRAR